jgi:hypothetical protein
MGLGSFAIRLGVPGGTPLVSENHSSREDAGTSPKWVIFGTFLANFGEFLFHALG